MTRRAAGFLGRRNGTDPGDSADHGPGNACRCRPGCGPCEWASDRRPALPRRLGVATHRAGATPQLIAAAERSAPVFLGLLLVRRLRKLLQEDKRGAALRVAEARARRRGQRWRGEDGEREGGRSARGLGTPDNTTTTRIRFGWGCAVPGPCCSARRPRPVPGTLNAKSVLPAASGIRMTGTRNPILVAR